MKRRNFLKHVSWTGAGIAWTLGNGGVLTACAAETAADAGTFRFVQISDSHIGFNQTANPDVLGTLKMAVDAINALQRQPDFVIHTGDITHLSKPVQFDAAKQILGTLRPQLVTIPGEHDVLGGVEAYADAFGRKDAPDGWFSWDQGGIHFVALVNVFDFENMGVLGSKQLAWLERDLAPQKRSTPIVAFGHVPLYALYPQWGWTTEDGTRALALLRRFDQVTVLNGHIHQIITHTEGNIVFATAAATAYPQPAPGKAPKPGPLTLPHDQLLHAIGYRSVERHSGRMNVTNRPLG